MNMLGNSLSQAAKPGRAEPSAQDMDLLMVHLDAAYNLAHWLLRNKAEAEDVVHEAYVRAMEHHHNFRGANRRGWLLTIVRHCCYDLMKRRSANTYIAFNEEMPMPFERSFSPESSLLWREQTSALEQALRNLPARFREVLILREFEEMAYTEIAAVVGIPIGTVMSRLSRAREQLRELMFTERKRRKCI